MTDPQQIVWDEFDRVVLPNVPPNLQKAAENALLDVIEQYAQPHRKYHYLTHLSTVLTELRRWRFRLSERQYLNAFIALLLHDVVYNIPAKNESNEVLSAEWVNWFVGVCGLRYATDQDQIEAAILVTEGHQPNNLIDLVVCWCDLAGFTKDDETSLRYTALIREEYLQVCTPAEYEAGRRVFLASYRSPFKTYDGAPLTLRLRARRYNRKANRQLDRELAEFDADHATV